MASTSNKKEILRFCCLSLRSLKVAKGTLCVVNESHYIKKLSSRNEEASMTGKLIRQIS